jgi:hypothetical protein
VAAFELDELLPLLEDTELALELEGVELEL